MGLPRGVSFCCCTESGMAPFFSNLACLLRVAVNQGFSELTRKKDEKIVALTEKVGFLEDCARKLTSLDFGSIIVV